MLTKAFSSDLFGYEKSDFLNPTLLNYSYSRAEEPLETAEATCKLQ
jgi:hypothetical protein